jgi:hypothetical protein
MRLPTWGALFVRSLGSREWLVYAKDQNNKNGNRDAVGTGSKKFVSALYSQTPEGW